MLVKCVCSNCGHSYLADDQAGDLACPRCGISNEGTRNPSDIPDAPAGAPAPPPPPPDLYDPYVHEEDDFGFESDLEFNPQEPPPMFLTGDRMARGVVFGTLAAAVGGAVLGGALAATKFALPLAMGLVLAFAAGPAARYGFGGRCARQTRGRAIAALVLSMFVGLGGFLVGSWAVERVTGDRASQTREDLEFGLRSLTAQRARVNDEGSLIVLEHRIAEANRLHQLNDAQLEDYLWMQQASVHQPLLAYATLRSWEGPVIQLGADADPIEVPKPVPAVALLAELLIALWISYRMIRPR